MATQWLQCGTGSAKTRRRNELASDCADLDHAADARAAAGSRFFMRLGEPIERPYVSCFANFCMAEYEAGPELIDQLKQGRDLELEAVDKADSPINLTVPLVDFANAYDGPAQEPKVFEESVEKIEKLPAELDERRKARCATGK